MGVRLAAALAVALVAVACHPAAGAAASQPAPLCASDSGRLEVRNYTGHQLDLYVVRPDGPPQYLSQLIPGGTDVVVPGPSDIAVRYDVVEPTARVRVATATWLRPTAGGAAASGVTLQLVCLTGRTPAP